MPSFKLNRRTLLKGLGGAVLGLPALEAMSTNRASAGEPPRRFVLVYAATSLAADANPANDPERVTPNMVGPGYDLKRALLALGAGALPANPGVGGDGYDVQKHTSIVSGLKIPWDTGSGVPPGGKSPEFHYNTNGPQLSGMRGGPGRTEPPNGPTADQIVADAIAGDTPQRSLSYRVQAATYVGTNGTGGSDGRISYRNNNGDLEAIDPIFSPQLAYSTLFGDFVPPDPAQAAAAQAHQKRHKSVVDLVEHRTEALMPKLGRADQLRMQRHLDEIRALEKTLATIPMAGGSCTLPADPGDDPPVAGAAIEYNGAGGGGAGYSNEELRASTLFDMVSMAFACDLTRVAAVRMSFSQCFLQMGQPVGWPGDVHSAIGHGGNILGYADCIGWHVKHFARFLAKLRDLEEVDGTSLLDHTAVVMLFEGGWGYDPESGHDHAAHSTEHMVALVGGHAGGLNPTEGKHIATQEAHPAQVVLSAMNAVGVAQDTNQLGEVSGKIDELFT